MKILDWLLGVIADPVPTLHEVGRHKPIVWAFMIYVGTTAVTSWTSGIDLQEYNLSSLQFFLGSLLFSIVMLFAVTGVLNTLAKGFQGTGSYWGLFSALGFAQFPAILFPVTRLLGEVAGRTGLILSGIFSFAIAVWVMVLNVLALRESQEFSTGKSILTYVLAWIIMVLVVVVAMVIGVLTMPAKV